MLAPVFSPINVEFDLTLSSISWRYLSQIWSALHNFPIFGPQLLVILVPKFILFTNHPLYFYDFNLELPSNIYSSLKRFKKVQILYAIESLQINIFILWGKILSYLSKFLVQCEFFFGAFAFNFIFINTLSS